MDYLIMQAGFLDKKEDLGLVPKMGFKVGKWSLSKSNFAKTIKRKNNRLGHRSRSCNLWFASYRGGVYK
jgi:hypothetical protein